MFRPTQQSQRMEVDLETQIARALHQSTAIKITPGHFCSNKYFLITMWVGFDTLLHYLLYINHLMQSRSCLNIADIAFSSCSLTSFISDMAKLGALLPETEKRLLYARTVGCYVMIHVSFAWYVLKKLKANNFFSHVLVLPVGHRKQSNITHYRKTILFLAIFNKTLQYYALLFYI